MGKIVTRPYTKAYGDGWDRIWGKGKEACPDETSQSNEPSAKSEDSSSSSEEGDSPEAETNGTPKETPN